MQKSKLDAKEKTPEFYSATGKMKHNLLNDYLFRIVMQKNPEALKQIISAILKVPAEEISDLEVTNSIIPGEVFDNKEFRMDITVRFNNNTAIDIELQVNDEHNWQTRGLAYLCRQYLNLVKKGEEYNNDLAAYQISFLDFTLFEDNEVFFADYGMRDKVTHYNFNSHFALFVVDLSRIDFATEEDKKSGLDAWCRLFKATTWEELKSIAKEDSIMEAVANDLYVCETDEIIQKRCEDREDYLRRQRHYERVEAERDALITENERLRAILKAHNISDEDISNQNG